MNLQLTLTFILKGISRALQLELDDFFEELGAKEDTVTKQAFSKTRANLNPDVVKASFELTTKTICECDDLALFKGKYRLCAIDGSDIALNNAPALKEHFGCSGGKSDATTALASVCYDTLNNVILDAGLYPYGTSERDGATANIKTVQTLPIPRGAQNLYIFDRGYPSKSLLAELIDGNIKFLMRVRKKFNIDFDLVEKKEKVVFTQEDKEYTVRVFRVELDSGESELLVTNLQGKHLKRSEIKELYFTRWKIETKFDSLKNKLELENMSGRRPVTVYQDFWAKLDLANTIAAAEFVTNDGITRNTADSGNKYKKTTNENRLISIFSKRYLDLLSETDTEKRVALFDEFAADVAKHPEDVKPNRKYSRKTPRKMKFFDTIKRVFR